MSTKSQMKTFHNCLTAYDIPPKTGTTCSHYSITYIQVIHAFCTSDTYKHTTIIPVVKKMSTNTIRGKWRVIVTDSRNSTWQIKIHTITSLEIHTMGLTCSFLLPAQTENAHEIDNVTTCAGCVCIYRPPLSLSVWLTRAIFRPPAEDRRRGELKTRFNVGKVLLKFYLNCSLDRENSMYT